MILIGFYSYSLSYSYIKVIYSFIASTSPDIRVEAIQDPALLHTFLNTCCGNVELSFEKVKREISKCSVRCFMRNIQVNSRLGSRVCLYSKQRLTERDYDLLGSRCDNFRHLQHSFSSRAAVLLTCLEDIAQNYSSDCFSYIPEIRYISTILKVIALAQDASSRSEICVLFVGKQASTLHWIANFAKNGTTKKFYIPSNRCQCLAVVSPITTFGQVWESCSQHF